MSSIARYPRKIRLAIDRYYNKTRHSGLETHITNSYLNPLLQLFKYIPIFRNCALQHAAGSCLSEKCLLCELGYLFDMIEKADGQSCQATNFLKAFSSIPEGMSSNTYSGGVAKVGHS